MSREWARDPDGPVLLVFPPAWEPDLPYLGPAQLAGTLRAAGIDTRLWDLNIEVFEALLEPERLHAVAAGEMALLEAVAEREALPHAEVPRYSRAVEATLFAGTLLETIQSSLDALREEEAWQDPDVFSQAQRILRRGLQLAVAGQSSTRLDLDGPRGPWDTRSLASLLHVAVDPAQNPYYHLLRRLAATRLERDRPLLLGITLVDPQQWLGTLTLLQACREIAPALPVFIGGPLVRVLADRLPGATPLLELVDGLVVGEGELPLRQLVDRLRANACFDDVPGLIRRPATGPVLVNPPATPGLWPVPAPSFVGLPLDRYLLPELVLPLQFSRGCYWRRCAFCSLSVEQPQHTRVQKPATVLATMKELYQAHGCTRFFFTDDALPPAPLRQLAARIAAEQLPFTWFGEIRLDDSLSPAHIAELAAGGCRMLVFGLESGHPRTLTAMHKGIRLEHVDRLLRACVDSQIAVHLWLIAGFPGESRAEALASLDFLRDRPWLLASPNFSAAFNRFVLPRHAPLALRGGEGLCQVGVDDPHLDLDQELDFTPLPRADGATPILPAEAEALAGELQALLDEAIPPSVRQNGRADNFLRQSRWVAAAAPAGRATSAAPDPGAAPAPPDETGTDAPAVARPPDPCWPRGLKIARPPEAEVAWLTHPLPRLGPLGPDPCPRYPRARPILLYHASSDAFVALPDRLGALVDLAARPAPLEPIYRALDARERRVLLDLVGLGALRLQDAHGPRDPATTLELGWTRQQAAELLQELDARQESRCPEGCARCCTSTVPVWPSELALLEEGLRGLAPAVRQQLLTAGQGAPDVRGLPSCPLLADARCLAYACRPLSCLLYGHPTAARPGNHCALRDAHRPREPQAIPEGLFYLFSRVPELAAGSHPGSAPVTIGEAVTEILRRLADEERVAQKEPLAS
ncbi:MAG: radical SAM protein [Myxococcota bacterium]|jgi:hypothetical protein|nr:radical SAM protein [Myxococcota bacterium]